MHKFRVHPAELCERNGDFVSALQAGAGFGMGANQGNARRGFSTLRLNTLSLASWAVISLADGAIATDGDSRLLMRLLEADARRIAREMTEAEALDDTGSSDA